MFEASRKWWMVTGRTCTIQYRDFIVESNPSIPCNSLFVKGNIIRIQSLNECQNPLWPTEIIIEILHDKKSPFGKRLYYLREFELLGASDSDEEKNSAVCATNSSNFILLLKLWKETPGCKYKCCVFFRLIFWNTKR